MKQICSKNKLQKEAAHPQGLRPDFGGPFTRMSRALRHARPGEPSARMFLPFSSSSHSYYKTIMKVRYVYSRSLLLQFFQVHCSAEAENIPSNDN